MVCQNCRNSDAPGWLGWNMNGRRVRCGWCNREEVKVALSVVQQEAQWEAVGFSGDDSSRLDRIRVPGGWLYRTIIWNASNARAVATTFVPDTKWAGPLSA